MAKLTLAQFESVISAATRPAILLSPDGTVRATNGLAQELIERSGKDLFGKSSGELFVRESREVIGEALNELVSTGKALELALTMKTGTGRRLRTDALATPIVDERGEFLGSSLTFRRRNTRKPSEHFGAAFVALLRPQNKRGPKGVTVAEIATWNDSATEVFGYDDPEVSGKNIELLVLPDHWKDLAEMLRIIASGHAVARFGHFSRTRCGEQVETISEAIPIRDQEQRVIGIAVRVHKVAPKEPAAIPRRQAKDEKAPTLVCDLEGSILTWSEEATRIFAVKKANAIGRALGGLLPESVRDDFAALLSEVALGRSVVLVNSSDRNPGDSLAEHSIRLDPVPDEDGHILGAACSFAPSSGPRRTEGGSRWFSSAPNIEALAGIGTWSIEATSEREYWLDRQARALFGFGEDEQILPGRILENIHPDDRADAHRVMQEAFSTGASVTYEFRIIRPDGSERWLRAVGEFVSMADGEPTRFFALVEDVTEQHQRLEQARRTQQFAEQLFEESPIGAQSVDPDGRIVVVNDTMLRLLGYRREEYLGRTIEEVTHPEDLARDEEIFNELRAGKCDSAEFSKRYLRADGTYIPGRLRLAALRDDEGNLINVVGQFLDESVAHELEDQLRYVSLYDPLTSLPKWDLVIGLVEHEIDLARNRDEHVGVAMIDLDHFVRVNDEFGNDIGDDALIEVKRRLVERTRTSDTIGRLEGDNFVIVRGGIGDPLEIVALAEELVAAFDAPFNFAKKPMYLTASVGVALGRPKEKAERLVRDAQLALMRAKESGGGHWVAYDKELRTRAQQRTSAEAGLREALRRDELVLHYQPIADLETGRFVGVEALLRWNHPERGLLLPEEFIGVAQESGLIVPIGRWVIETACEEIGKWKIRSGHAPIGVSINISPVQFHKDDLVDIVCRSLSASCLAPERLTVELVESSLEGNAEEATRILSELHNLGVRLSIDDFGTGYSSLGRIRHFAIDELKVDRTFTKALAIDESARSIVAAVIEMGRALDATVVAEGVDDEFAVDWLRLHRCRLAQGFLFAHPMPAAEAKLAVERGYEMSFDARATA